VAEFWGQANFESHIKPHLDECFSGHQTRYRCWFEFAQLGRRYFDVAYYPYFDETQTVTDAVVISRDMTDYKVMEEKLRKAQNELEHRVEKRTAELEQTNKQLRQEIKERKQVEQTLRHSAEKYRAVVEQSADYIFLVDVATNQIIEANPALQSLLGYAGEELLNLTIYDIVAHSKESIHANAQQILSKGSHYLGERRYQKKDGQIVEVEVNANVISYQNRDVVCVVTRDITERKQAEEALQESEKRYKQLLESVTDYIYSVKIVEGQPASTQHGPGCLAVTGYSQQELLAMNFWEVIHPDFREPIKKQGFARQQGQAIPPRHELKLMAKDGTERWIDVTLGIIDFEGETAVLGTACDITERKQAEQ